MHNVDVTVLNNSFENNKEQQQGLLCKKLRKTNDLNKKRNVLGCTGGCNSATNLKDVMKVEAKNAMENRV